MQFRNGIRFLVQCPVLSATEIAAGDLLYWDNGMAKPAADYPWNTDLATTQANFAAAFLGVAYSNSALGESHPVSVDVSPFAFYEAETATTLSTFAAFVAPSEEAPGVLSNRVLAATLAASQAIGRVTKIATGSQKHAGVSLASSVFTASANVNAALG